MSTEIEAWRVRLHDLRTLATGSMVASEISAIERLVDEALEQAAKDAWEDGYFEAGGLGGLE